jgi:hypothetical protein
MDDNFGSPATQFPETLLEKDIVTVGLPVEVGEVEDSRVKNLMFCFESLGENCEFGLVQRRYGAEPLGLFRWSTTQPSSLIEILQKGFSGFGELGTTEIRAAPWGELIAHDANYTMAMHTFVHKNNVDLKAFRQNQCQRMAFLKRKVVEDLQSGEKIFVYQAGHRLTDGITRRIFELLNRYGANRLLAVNLSREGQPSGSVELLEPGLLRGHIDRFGKTVTPNGTRWNINNDAWVSLCEQAQQLL